ncbi:MAG: hypothetical protein IKV03_06495 [Alphaproteobacteria bacterium]|nr:hypothetical protein [Alphaproteobacteria bacterium]
MKRLGLFSIALLAGCVPTQKEYTIIRETSRPVVQTEEQSITPAQSGAVETKTTAVVSETTPATSPCPHVAPNGKPACMQPAPTYFAGTYNQPQGVYQTQQHIAYQSGGCGGQVMCGQNLASTLGGTIMNMPAQTMHATSVPIQMPTQQVQVQSMPLTMPAAPQMIQTEVFYETQTVPMNAQIMAQMPTAVQAQLMGTPDVILQHPINRDLVKCSFGDMNCLIAYEAQGYAQLHNTTVAPTYNAVVPNQNYTVSGTWQDNNNIPRW